MVEDASSPSWDVDNFLGYKVASLEEFNFILVKHLEQHWEDQANEEEMS